MDKMSKDRYAEWVENSYGLIQIEILILGNAQGLGLIDVELIKDFPEIKISSELDGDKLKKLRHITLSEWWVAGAYELVRLLDEMLPRHKSKLSELTNKKIKEVLSLFTEVRIPLVKFQERGKGELYSGVPVPVYDETKGAGWKIHSLKPGKVVTKIFYRKDLADRVLDLFGDITKDIYGKYEGTHGEIFNNSKDLNKE